jgi:hypothetical protein
VWSKSEVRIGSALVVGAPQAGPVPLTGARAEAERLGTLLPGARVLIGPQAEEARVRSEIGRHAIVHFATHARVDMARPLSSGLLLSVPRNLSPVTATPPAAALVPVPITSEPSGTEVYLDGSFVGTAPLSEYRVAPGEHLIEIRKAGFVTWSRRVVIVSGAPTRIDAVLEPTRP